MRVLLVNHYAVGPNDAGGTRHLRLAAQWDAAGHEVRILRSSFNHFSPSARATLPATEHIGQRSRMDSVPTRGYADNGLRRALGMGEFAVRVSLMRRYFQDADVVVGSTPHPLAALAALVGARRARVPFVLEVRDLWPQTLVDMGALRPARRAAQALYRMEKLLVEQADGVVVIPPDAKSYFAARGLDFPETVHIPNLADLHGQSAEPSSSAESVIQWITQQRAAGARSFCYAGTLGRANALGAVIKTFTARVDDKAILVVCGDGPERRELLALARDDHRIRFTGHLPRNDALEVLRASDVAVFHLADAPVFAYGLSPNKLLDYLAAGKPILYAGPDVQSPVTGSAAHISARPGDVRSIAEAVDKFVALRDAQLGAMGARAHDHLAENFSTRRLADRYLQFLSAAVDARS